MVTDINKVIITKIEDTKLKREIVKHLFRMGITEVAIIEVMSDQELLIPGGLLPEELAEVRKVIPVKRSGKSLGTDELPIFSFKVREFLTKNNITKCSQLEHITDKELVSRYRATSKIIKEIRIKFEEPHFYKSEEISDQGKLFIEDINLTKRTYIALKKNGFKRYEDVAKLTIDDLKELDRMGKGTIEEIVKVFGLKSIAKPRKKRGRKPKMIIKDELETMGLTTRTHNILKRFGCKTKEDVLNLPVEKLLEKKGLGLSTKKEFERVFGINFEIKKEVKERKPRTKKAVVAKEVVTNEFDPEEILASKTLELQNINDEKRQEITIIEAKINLIKEQNAKILKLEEERKQLDQTILIKRKQLDEELKKLSANGIQKVIK